MVLVGKHDSYASRAVLRSFPSFGAFAFGVRLFDVALLVEDNRIGLADRFAGARQEYINERQGAEHRPGAQLPSHIIGLKKAETQYGA